MLVGSGVSQYPFHQQSVKPWERSANDQLPSLRPLTGPKFGKKKEQEKPKPRSAEDLDTSRQRFLDEAGLTQQLVDIEPNALKEQVYPDLRIKHWWFWKNQSDKILKGISSPFVKLYSLLTASSNRSDARLDQIVEYARKRVEPAHIEKELENSPFFRQMQTVIDLFGPDSPITVQAIDAKIQSISEYPTGTKEEQHQLESLEFVKVIFPSLAALYGKADVLTGDDLNVFKTQIKQRIPFLFETFELNATHYFEDAMYRIGASDTAPTPHRGLFRRTEDVLNKSENYRKMARFLQKNQASDFQFLPLFSFIGATYGQLVLATAPQDSAIYKPFEWGNVFKQMVELDGAYEGIGYFIAKLQLLLVRWKEEKPDKQRAQWQKRLFELAAEHKKIEEHLKPKLDEFNEINKQLKDISENPGQGREQEKAELQTRLRKLEAELKPLNEQSRKVMQTIDKYQLELEKLVGLKPMGFVERMWKKPPKVLNDTVLMTMIGMPLTLSYEYFFYNFQAGDGVSLGLFSPEMMQLLGLFTTLGVFSNILYKAIIHTTQDRKRLYQLGEKDQLMAENTREYLANLKGFVDDLKKSDDPQVQKLGQVLAGYYDRMATPLIGDEAQQAENQKKKSQEAKLAFSMEAVDAFKPWQEKAEQGLKGAKGRDAKYAHRKFVGLMNGLSKTLDRIGYAQISTSNFELQLLSDRYNNFKAKFDAHVPEELREAFRETHSKATRFLHELVDRYPNGELRAEPLLKKAGKDFEELNGLFESAKAEIAEMNKLSADPAHQEIPRGLHSRLKKIVKKLNKGVDRNLKFLHAKNKKEADEELAALWEKQKDSGSMTEKMSLMATIAGKRVVNADRYNSWLTGLYYIPMLSLTNVMGRLGMFTILDPAFLAQPIGVLARFFRDVWLKQHILIRTIGFFQEKVLVLRHLQHDQKLAVQREMEKGGPKFYMENRIREAETKRRQLDA